MRWSQFVKKKFVVAAMPAVLVVGCGGGGGGDVAAPIQLNAKISRTSYGIPHIEANTKIGAGFGIGYAFAEDNFCLLAEEFVTVKGERSKYFGEAGTYKKHGTTPQNNLTSDFFYRLVNSDEKVASAWAQQSAEVRELTAGYVAGFNRYLDERGVEGLPQDCKNAPWVRQITVEDMLRRYKGAAVQASLSFIDGIANAQPPSPSMASQLSDLSSDLLQSLSYEDVENKVKNPLGSNAVALGRTATETGKGLLLANPHFPWAGANRFYQFHVTIPGELDAMGASLFGFPVVLVGFNKDVAWTHTVNTSGHATFFRLQIDSEDPTTYVVDGIKKPMTTQSVTVETLQPDGSLAERTRTFYGTEHGMMITMPTLGMVWNQSVAFAYNDANMENDRMVQQWYEFNKSRSVHEIKSAVESIVGVPWVYTHAADRNGDVLTANVTVVPNISKEKETVCLVPAYKPYMPSIFVLDGTTSNCRWTEENGAPQKGIFPGSKLPSLIRSDYVQNSNDSAWLTNPNAPITGQPSIVSLDGIAQNGRTRLGISQIQSRLNGSDGRSGTKFNINNLLDIAFSNRSYFSVLLQSDLEQVCATGTTVIVDGVTRDISAGCNIVANWDGTSNTASVGVPLFAEWRKILIRDVPGFWAVPFNPDDPVNTPRGIDLNSSAAVEGAKASLAKAMMALDTEGVDYQKPWGQVQVAVRGEKNIPIPGYHENDSYNWVQSISDGRGKREVVHGSSIVLAVTFDESGPLAKGMLTYSQSTNPDSMHYSDQTELFSNLDWYAMPFTPQSIQADPNYSSKTISQ